MKIIESISEMREYSQQLKCQGKTIAAVQTVGYLHDGHMSLVKIAKENADVVVMNTNAMSELLVLSIEWPKNYKKLGPLGSPLGPWQGLRGKAPQSG